MSARTAVAPKTPQKLQRELEDLQLVLKARNGSQAALDQLMRRYHGFVRLKASSYFLAGGDADDLIQEGMIGLYKAMRDFRHDKETSFRSFAELCVTRQIITAIKTATRFKHSPLNTYVSFSHTPAGQESDGDCTLGDALPGPSTNDPSSCVISTEELQSLVGCLGTTLSLARVRRAPPLPRRQVVRHDGRRARVRHEDDRQRAAAGEAQDRRAPGDARRPRLALPASDPVVKRAAPGRLVCSCEQQGAVHATTAGPSEPPSQPPARKRGGRGGARPRSAIAAGAGSRRNRVASTATHRSRSSPGRRC